MTKHTNHWGTIKEGTIEWRLEQDARRKQKETQETVNKMRNWAHRQLTERGIDIRNFDGYDFVMEMSNPALWNKLSGEQKQFVSDLYNRFAAKVEEVCNA